MPYLLFISSPCQNRRMAECSTPESQELCLELTVLESRDRKMFGNKNSFSCQSNFAFCCDKNLTVGCHRHPTEHVNKRKCKVVTPAFSVTCIGDISTCSLPTCYLNGCLTMKQAIFHIISGRNDK